MTLSEGTEHCGETWSRAKDDTGERGETERREREMPGARDNSSVWGGGVGVKSTSLICFVSGFFFSCDAAVFLDSVTSVRSMTSELATPPPWTGVKRTCDVNGRGRFRLDLALCSTAHF